MQPEFSPSFDAVAFAGGGARCYWQGGFWEALTAVHPQRPRFIVGVSAGAYQACFSLLGLGASVRQKVITACLAMPRDIDWSELRRGRSPFIVGQLYSTLLNDVFGKAELAALKQAPELLIQVSHPPRLLPGAVAALPAIAAYQVEKLLTGAAHSRAARYLGFATDWVSTHAVNEPEELVAALMATASVPPFMPVGRVRGRAALDGGLTDNPPLGKLAEVEAGGGSTLVLSTRSGRMLASTDRRVIAGPSEPIAVSKFTVTDGDGIRRAYELGLRDGEAFATRFSA